MTEKQFESTLSMFRNGCAPKFPKLSPGLLLDISSINAKYYYYDHGPSFTANIDGLKEGKFDENNKDLKCYTACVAQMAATVRM